jgi:hypothetical protein
MENYEIVIGFKKQMHPDLPSPDRQIKQCPLMILSIAMDLKYGTSILYILTRKTKKRASQMAILTKIGDF